MTTQKKKKPKILIVTWFHCLRNVKLAIGAWLCGYELELITKPQGFGLINELQFLHIYKSVRLFENTSQCEAYVKESDADVIWCHNEPDMMTEIAVGEGVKRDRIVIHDCHDIPTLHPGREKEFAEQEKIACTESDYIFVPTPDYVTMLEEKYNRKNVLQVNSCLPGIFYPDSDFPRVNGMLYCGQVNVPSMKSKLHYRDCLPLFQYLTGMGLATHIYHTNPSADLFPYTVAGASVYGVLRLYAAVHQYTRYDYGFVGSNVDCKEIQICMPNKLLDCIAAGIPMVALNAKTAGRFIEDNGFGISIQGLENMKEVPWANMNFWEDCRKRVREHRYEYTAEKEVRKAFDKIGI